MLESFFHEMYVLVFVLNRTALYYFPFDSKFVNVLFQSKMGFSLKKMLKGRNLEFSFHCNGGIKINSKYF